MGKIKLYHGDCFEIMPTLANNSIDMVFADVPYNITQASWDKDAFNLAGMWNELNRIVKNKRAMVFTATFPFAADLVSSNRSNFRSDWVYSKGTPTGHLNARIRPMRSTESVLVFSNGGCPNYYPQKIRREKARVIPGNRGRSCDVYAPYLGKVDYRTDALYKHPTQIIHAKFNSAKDSGGSKEQGFHPTQKPVSLITYLIKTYSKPDATVLDFTMGSGSTGVAAVETGRRFIGIELDKSFYDIAAQRIK